MDRYGPSKSRQLGYLRDRDADYGTVNINLKAEADGTCIVHQARTWAGTMHRTRRTLLLRRDGDEFWSRILSNVHSVPPTAPSPASRTSRKDPRPPHRRILARLTHGRILARLTEGSPPAAVLFLKVVGLRVVNNSGKKSRALPPPRTEVRQPRASPR